jgi:hypothetical protein
MRRIQVYPSGARAARDAPRIRKDNSSRHTLESATATPDCLQWRSRRKGTDFLQRTHIAKSHWTIHAYRTLIAARAKAGPRFSASCARVKL